MKLWVKLTALFRRRKLDAEMAEEMRLHLERRTEENASEGMSPEEARYAALRQFGGVEQVKEIAREQRGWTWLEQTRQDLRYAARQMRKHPGFAIIVVLILGLGIGANTAVFSALEVLLLRPLPVLAPDQLVTMTYVRTPTGASAPIASSYLTPGFFEQVREQSQSLAGVLAINGSGGMRLVVLPSDARAEPVRVRTNDVSGSYFTVLRVPPFLGRLIMPEDDIKGAPRAVAVLSHAYWQRQFGGDRNIIGKTVVIEKIAFEIIGIAPEGFGGLKVGEPVEVWTPLWMLPAVNPRLGSNLSRPNWNGIQIMGRLRPGVSRSSATAELNVLLHQAMAAAMPEVAPADQAQRFGQIVLEPGAGGLQSDARNKGRPILGILLAVVVLVQLIACANVASLSLARLATRRRELAARTALGAGRGRILRQLLTEALLLVAGGVVLGGLLVQWGFIAARTQGLDATPSGWILLFALAVSVITGVIVALVPALRSSRIDLASELKGQGGAVTGNGRPRLQQMLVIVQLAVCGCLLAGTGYFVRTLQELRQIDLGFAGDHLLFVTVDTPAGYDANRRSALLQELLRGVGQLPGVAHVTSSTTGLFNSGVSEGAITVDGYVPQAGEHAEVKFVFAGPDYFATVGLPLLRGRGLEFADVFPTTKPAAAGAVINERVARQFFGETDPIGRRFRWGTMDYEVVGVARNSKYRSLREENPLICYIPQPGFAWPVVALQIRSVGKPDALVTSMVAAVRRIDPNTTVRTTQTMDDVMRQATAEESMTALGVGAFSALALLLTALGLYGLLAYNVTQRTREIGVRIALGGRPGDIVGLILKQGLVLTAIGWAIGIAGAMGLVRLVASRLYGVSGADPIVLLGSGALLALVAAVACWLPARRATKVDPMVALRAE